LPEGSLWDGGASIRVGGRHVGNWLIGQIIDEDADLKENDGLCQGNRSRRRGILQSIKRSKKNACKHSSKRFAEALYLIANQLSLLTMQNIQIERDLRESEEKFKTIGNSARDAIVMIDNNGNITFWNTGAEKIFGYTEEEVTGKNFHLLITPERFHENHFKAFKEFKKTGKGGAIGKTLELFAMRKNGEEFPVELSLSSVNIKRLMACYRLF
jgi:PAS domain S-box-containing protein